MPRAIPRHRRQLYAFLLAAVAIGLVVLEPFPKGKVLFSFTERHGVDAGDLPAIILMLVAACLAISRKAGERLTALRAGLGQSRNHE